MFTYEYERPSLTTDTVIFKEEDETIYVLVIKRKNEPYKGMYALPGGFMEMNESLRDCAIREVKEETNLSLPKDIYFIEMLDDPNRDSRGRVLSGLFMCIYDESMGEPKANDDALEVTWLPVMKLDMYIENNEWQARERFLDVNLAFDHEYAIQQAWLSFYDYH